MSQSKDIAIKVDGVAKKFLIGSGKSASLRETIMGWFQSRKDEKKEFWALKDITFELERGQVLGIIGRNGAGKSTLLKVLSRITEPTHGRIEIHGRVASLLEVGTGFHPELTGRENIFLNGTILGMTRSEVRAKMHEIIEFSGVEKFIDTPVKRYSSGMYVRLAFSVAAHLEPEILVIDEVLAVGDAEFQKKCLGKMEDVARQGRTVLFVSHNMAAVKSLCTKGLLIEKGKAIYLGDVKSTLDRYMNREDLVMDDGSIPTDQPREYSTGEARLSNLRLFNEEDKNTNEFYYRETLELKLEFEAKQALSNCLIGITVALRDGTGITYYDSGENAGKTFDFSAGKNSFSIQLDNQFLPGNYTIHLFLSHANGKWIDHLENVADFSVLKASREKDQHYPWGSNHGYIRGKANWKQN